MSVRNTKYNCDSCVVVEKEDALGYETLGFVVPQ